MARCAAGVLRVKGLKVALLFLLVGWSSAGLPPDKQNEYVDVNPRPAEDAAQKPPGGGGGVVADHLFGDPNLDEEQQTEGAQAYKVVFAHDGTDIRLHHDSMAHDQLVTVGQQDVAIHNSVTQGSALTEEVSQKDVRAHQASHEISALAEKVSQDDVPSHKATSERSALVEQVSQQACEKFSCPPNYVHIAEARVKVGNDTETCCVKACSSHSCPQNYVLIDSATTTAGTDTKTCCIEAVECCAKFKRPWGLTGKACYGFPKGKGCPKYKCGGVWEERNDATDPPISKKVGDWCPTWRCEITIDNKTYCKDVPAPEDMSGPSDQDLSNLWQDIDDYGNGRFYCPPLLFETFQVYSTSENRQGKYSRSCTPTGKPPETSVAEVQGKKNGEKKCCHLATADETGVAKYTHCEYRMWDEKCGELGKKLGFTALHKCRLDEFGDRFCPPPNGFQEESRNDMCEFVKKSLTENLNLEALFKKSERNCTMEGGYEIWEAARGASYCRPVGHWFKDVLLITSGKVTEKAWESWAKHVKLLKVADDPTFRQDELDPLQQEIEMLNELTFGDIFSLEWYQSERWRMRQVGLITESFGPGDDEGGIEKIHVDSAHTPFDETKLKLKDMSLRFMSILQSDFRIRRVIRKACGLEAVTKRHMVDYWLEIPSSELGECKNAVNQQLATDKAEAAPRAADAEKKEAPRAAEVDPEEDGARKKKKEDKADEELVVEEGTKKQYDQEIGELTKKGSKTAKLMASEDFTKKRGNFTLNLANQYLNLKEKFTEQFPTCKGIPADTLLAFAEWVAQQIEWEFAPPSPLWEMDNAAPVGKSAYHGHGTCTVTGSRRGSGFIAGEFGAPARRSNNLQCPEGTHCLCPKHMFFKKRNLKAIRSGVDTSQIAHAANKGATEIGLEASVTTGLNALGATAYSLISDFVGPGLLLAVMGDDISKGRIKRAGLSALKGVIGTGVGFVIAAVSPSLGITSLLLAISCLPMYFLGRFFTMITQSCEARLGCFPAEVENEKKNAAGLIACGMGAQAKKGGSPAWFLPAPNTAVLLNSDGTTCSEMDLCSPDARATQEIGFKKVTVDGVLKGWSVFNCQPLKVSEMLELDLERTDKLSVKFAKKVWATADGTAWKEEACNLCETLKAGCQCGGAFLNMSLASSAIEAPGIVQHRKKKKCQAPKDDWRKKKPKAARGGVPKRAQEASNDKVLKHESSLEEEVLHEVRSIGVLDGQ